VGDVLRVSGRLHVAVHDPLAQRITDAPLEQIPQISWGSAVLAATYRGLCSAVMRLTSRETIFLGCPLVL
jgi:hypothetical protein